MRVLVLTSLYPPHALGGYELSCRDVVDRWRADGTEVTVLTTSTRFAGAERGGPQPHVRRELEWYWHEHELRSPAPRERLAIERRNRTRLKGALRDVRPDVVSVWAMGAMSLSLFDVIATAGLPAVCVVEDDWLVYGPRLDAWVRGWSHRPRWLAAAAQRVFGVPTGITALPPRTTVAFASNYLRERAVTDGSIALDDTAIVPLGIDPVDFPLRDADEARPWSWRLLAVGRIEPRKGFDAAVRALVELPEATLRIVGPADPRHLDELQALATELGVADRLTMLARRREELAAEYAGADVLLFPSRWDEPFGMVPLEAMSQATPVVATRRGGSAEFLVDGRNCLQIDADDPAGVAAAVRRLADDEKLRATLVRDGRATAADYSVDRFAAGLTALHVTAARRQVATV